MFHPLAHFPFRGEQRAAGKFWGVGEGEDFGLEGFDDVPGRHLVGKVVGFSERGDSEGGSPGGKGTVRRRVERKKTGIGSIGKVGDEEGAIGIEKGEELELENNGVGVEPGRKRAEFGGCKLGFKKCVADVDLGHLTPFVP